MTQKEDEPVVDKAPPPPKPEKRRLNIYRLQSGVRRLLEKRLRIQTALMLRFPVSITKRATGIEFTMATRQIKKKGKRKVPWQRPILPSACRFVGRRKTIDVVYTDLWSMMVSYKNWKRLSVLLFQEFARDVRDLLKKCLYSPNNLTPASASNSATTWLSGDCVSAS